MPLERIKPTAAEVKDWPDAAGWWWARPKDKASYIPGDELCVEVTLASRITRFFIQWRGESYGEREEKFQGMEWIPTASPWACERYRWKHKATDGYCKCDFSSVWASFPCECRNCFKVLQGYPIPNDVD